MHCFETYCPKVATLFEMFLRRFYLLCCSPAARLLRFSNNWLAFADGEAEATLDRQAFGMVVIQR
jgi:hypothetical protein